MESTTDGEWSRSDPSRPNPPVNHPAWKRQGEGKEHSVDQFRTAVPPISKLPDEILAHIFEFCASAHVPFMGWIASTTYICRRWREVALSNRALWRHIPLDKPQWRDAFLSRSGASPIIIMRSYEPGIALNGGASTEPIEGETALICQHVSHIRNMTLIGPAEILATTANRLLSPAPLLESIMLFISSVTDESSHLPPNFLALHTPRISRVSLSGFICPWSSPLLRNLTTLTLSSSLADFMHEKLASDTPSVFRPSSDEFFAFLEGAQGLRSLSLMNCLPRGAQLATDDRIGSLPALNYLLLGDQVENVVGVLTHILLRPDVKVALNCELALATDCRSLFRAIGVHFSAKGRSLDTLKIASFMPLPMAARIEASGWAGVEEHEGQPDFARAQEPDFDLHAMNSLAHPLPLMAPDIFDALSFGNTQALSLDISDLDDWTPARWAQAFRRYQHVQHVRVKGGRAVRFFPVLGISASKEDDTSGGPDHNLFAKLSSLTLQSCDFDGYNEEVQSQLEDALTNRRIDGIPLERLRIEQCRVQAVVVSKLWTLVPDVFWDGLEHDPEAADGGEDGEEDNELENAAEQRSEHNA